MDSDDSDNDPQPRLNNLDGEHGQQGPGTCVICLANLTHPNKQLLSTAHPFSAMRARFLQIVSWYMEQELGKMSRV